MKPGSSLLQFIILIGLFVSGDCRNDSETTGFLNFLSDAVYNYTNWVCENYPDPGPINPVEYEIDVNNHHDRFNLTLKLRDEQVRGYCETYLLEGRVGVDMDTGTMYIHRMQFAYYILGGNYSVNGTDFYGDPITGEEEWSWELNWGLDTIQEGLDYTFEISPDGYVHITNPPLYSLDPILWDSKLWVGEFEFRIQALHIVNSIYLALYNRYVAWYPEHPTGSLMHRYFTELFKKTPYAEIISYPGSQHTRTTGRTEKTNNSICVTYNDTRSVSPVHFNST